MSWLAAGCLQTRRAGVNPSAWQEMPKGRVNLQPHSLGFFASETEERGPLALPPRPALAFPRLSQPGGSITGERGVMHAAAFGFSPVLGHTMTWEHPGAAGGALPCPPARPLPEMMLGSFRELGSSLMLKAREA